MRIHQLQLNDILRDRFICGLRAEQINRKLLSANFTFQEAVDAVIAQKKKQEGCTTLWRKSSRWKLFVGVKQVKRDNVWSHGHSMGRRHQRKRCFRHWLNNHTPEKSKYKDSECFKCHLRGYSRSVAMQNHHQKRWRANNMYITRNKIQKLDCKRTWEMNFLSPFLPWKRVRS